jgi:hypothetical protein
MSISQQALVCCSGLCSPVLHVVSFFLSRLDNKHRYMKLKLPIDCPRISIEMYFFAVLTAVTFSRLWFSDYCSLFAPTSAQFYVYSTHFVMVQRFMQDFHHMDSRDSGDGRVTERSGDYITVQARIFMPSRPAPRPSQPPAGGVSRISMG